MADEIGKVSFGLEATFDDKGLKDAEKGLNKLGAAAGETKGGMTSLGVALGTAGGILAVEFTKAVFGAIPAMIKMAEVSAAGVEALGHLGQQTGFTAQQFMELEPVLKRNNVSVEQIAQSFRILSRQIHESQDPSSDAAQGFRDLGLTLSGLETPSQVFNLIADRIKVLPDGFQKTRLETLLLGRAGAQLTAILNEGSEGFARSAREAKAMGNVLNTDAIQRLEALDDSFDNVGTSSENLSRHLAVLFAPFLQAMNEARVTSTNFFVGLIDQATIASRTLGERLRALGGFLSDFFNKDTNKNFANTSALWDQYNAQAAEAVARIRDVGVSVQGMGTSFDQADAHVLAFQRHQEGSWTKFNADILRLTNQAIELGFAWTIVEDAIAAYGVQQKGVAEQQRLMVSFGLAGTNQMIKLEDDLQASYRATMEAGLRARQVSGSITPVQLATAQGAEAVNAMQREIASIGQLQAAEQTAFLQHMSITAQESSDRATQIAKASADHAKRLTLIGEQNQADAQRLSLINAYTEREKELNNQLLVLTERLRAAKITASADVGVALEKENAIRLQAVDAIAGAELRMAQASFADTSVLRALRLRQIETNAERELAVVGLTEEQKTAIYRNAEASRMEISRQFPTFFQKQMQDLVSGNAFSLAQISTNFTNAAAQWVVTGTNFKAFWQQLQVTLVQAALNSLIQMGANLLLQQTSQGAQALALHTSLEATKTAISVAANATRTVATIFAGKVANAAALAATVASADAQLAVMEGVVIAIAGVFAAIGAGLAASVVGAEFAPAFEEAAGATIVAGTAALILAEGTIEVATTAAGAATFGPGFASGGMADFGRGTPTVLHGKEAVIPLNDRGADYMSKLMGMGKSPSGQTVQIHTVIEVDGRALANIMSEHQPGAWRTMGVI